VVDGAFDWRVDEWRAPDLRDLVLYELHVGSFTPEGTFDAAAERLPALRELGITAVELMPVAQFPGARGWGYDGVLAFATQRSYGGPEALKRFVDAAHALDMNVFLDVVYNHLGPEGNYLGRYGPYFTDTYHTPWGAALNFDGPAATTCAATSSRALSSGRTSSASTASAWMPFTRSSTAPPGRSCRSSLMQCASGRSEKAGTWC
jgi:maltooligosyltrehalose trehalohydrolase